jgi:two-component system response regulator FlrC
MKATRKRKRDLAPYVLIVEDDPIACTVMADILTAIGIGTECRKTVQSALDVPLEDVGIALLDVQLPDGDGLDLLKSIRQRNPQLPCVMVTVEQDINRAVTAIRSGAADYLVKPVSPQQLADVVNRYITQSSAAGSEMAPLPWTTPTMRDIHRRTQQARRSFANVLIEGERGTGKGRIAKWIPSTEFAVVNLEGTEDEEVARTLFGEPTNANLFSRKPGLLVNKSTRAIILESIEYLGPRSQGLLLRHLKQIATAPHSTPLQLISTTHRSANDLTHSPLVQELLHYLGTIHLTLPRLSSIKPDIKVWANLLLGELAFSHGKRHRSLTDEAIGWMESQEWPGNIPQLRRVLAAALVTTEALLIDVADLEATAAPSPPIQSREAIQPTRTEAEELNIKKGEVTALRHALKMAKGNRRKASELLGVSLRTVYYMIKRYGSDVTQ